MYLDFFNLRLEPFATTPDPQFLFKSAVHQEALDRLIAAVTMRRGINAIIGEPGLGKSMLIRTTLQGFNNSVRFAWVFNTNMNSRELIKYICRDFGFTPQGEDLSDLLMELYTFLIKAYEEGAYTVLIVDEAQNLKFEVLEEIRQLSNLETSRNKLLQIILSGQPQLDTYLEDPALHQLKQRISLKATLSRLDENDSRGYIQHRMHVAGRRAQEVFTDSAMKKIHVISDGVPRLINQVCDNALLAAFQKKLKSVDSVLIQELLDHNMVTSAQPRVQPVDPAPVRAIPVKAQPVVPRPLAKAPKQGLVYDFNQVGNFGGVDVESL
jgi:general secretion pathway protein A